MTIAKDSTDVGGGDSVVVVVVVGSSSSPQFQYVDGADMYDGIGVGEKSLGIGMKYRSCI